MKSCFTLRNTVHRLLSTSGQALVAFRNWVSVARPGHDVSHHQIRLQITRPVSAPEIHGPSRFAPLGLLHPVKRLGALGFVILFSFPRGNFSRCQLAMQTGRNSKDSRQYLTYPSLFCCASLVAFSVSHLDACGARGGFPNFGGQTPVISAALRIWELQQRFHRPIFRGRVRQQG